MMKDQLWLQVSDIFLVNDGSLPEVTFKELSVAEVSSAYQLLRQFGGGFECNTYYWSIPEQRDLKVLSTDRVEDIFAIADGKHFHVLILDVRSPSKLPVPTLGIGVGEDWITIDYRMGLEWTPDAVFGFFEIVSALQDLTMASTITHGVNANDPGGRRFIASLRDWRNTSYGGRGASSV